MDRDREALAERRMNVALQRAEAEIATARRAWHAMQAARDRDLAASDSRRPSRSRGSGL